MRVTRIRVRSWSAVRTFVPAVGGPCPSDQAAHGDDRVGEVEEGIDDVDLALVAPGNAVKGVLPGVGAFDIPTLARLDRCLLAPVCDAAVQATLVEQSPGSVGVVAGVQVHSDVLGQRPEVVKAVQGGGEQGGVVAVGAGQDAAQGNAVSVRHTRAFQALFAAFDRGASGDLAAAGGLGDGAVDGDLVEDEAKDPVVGLQRDLFEPGEYAKSYPLVATVSDRGC